MNPSDYSKRPERDKERLVPLDLRGVPCPLSWAKAKIALEQVTEGVTMEILLNDPKGARDLPRAAEGEGYYVLEVERRTEDWRILICK